MKPIYTLFLCLFTVMIVRGQTAWMAYNDLPATIESIFSSKIAPNGDVFSVGWSNINVVSSAMVSKNDGSTGQLLWTRTYASTYGTQLYDIEVHPQGFYACGSTYMGPNTDNAMTVAAFDPNGDSLWFKTYDLDTGSGNEYASDIDIVGNGLLIGGAYGVPQSLFIMKTDLNGDSLWTTITDVGVTVYEIIGLEQLGNKIYVAFKANSINGMHNSMARFDTLGNFIDVFHYSGFLQQQGITNGDGFRVISGDRLLMCGSQIPQSTGMYIIIDTSGSVIQTQLTGMAYTLAVTEAISNNDILAVGFTNGNDSVCLERRTAGGSLVFRKQYRRNMLNGINFMYSLQATPDGGFLMGGVAGPNNDTGGWVIKTDSAGNALTNIISGNVFADFDNDCVQDPGDFSMPGIMLLLMPDSIYQMTDTAGNYCYSVGAGTYTVTALNMYGIWTPVCPLGGSYTVNFPLNNHQADSLGDFAFHTTSSCAIMQADLTVNSFRSCQNRPGAIHYNNIGTDTAYNAYLELQLSPVLTLTGASMPYAQNGDLYTFQLGDLPPFQPGMIQLQIFTGCNATLGTTECISVTAYPDTNCSSPGPNYDQSFIEVQGYCINNDTVKFVLRNVGSGNMTAQGTFTLYEDNIIFLTQPYQLPANDSIEIPVPVNGTGKSYFLETQQHPDYTGLSYPIAYVEGCGSPIFSLGIIPMFPLHDYDPYYDLECDVIINSYDPNDKTGFPLGFFAQHYITANDPLEYRVRFQNTGNDTCYTVVIRDTISSFLDLGTFQPGASSHPYTVIMNAGREVVFRFENINLPDSNTNEPASNGFVNYNIRQVPGNAPGTEILNTAYIFFDFNGAVITNTSLHTIEIPQMFHPMLVIPGMTYTDISISPNPTSNWVRITSDEWKEGWNFSLWSVDGKRVLQQALFGPDQLISLENLAPGTYFYRLEDSINALGSGKIIKW